MPAPRSLGSVPSPPRVAVDATAVPADRGGVGRYVDELLPALAAEGADLVGRLPGPRRRALRASSCPDADLRAAPAAIARRPVAAGLGAGRACRGWPGRPAPTCCTARTTRCRWSSRVPVVTTLHDATFFTHPEVHLPVKRRFFRTWTRISLRRARRCVTPSAATRDELVRVAGADAERVDVAHLGVDPARFHVPTAGERAAARAHLGSTGRYVAFLGTLEPRKNVPALIRGWWSDASTTHPPSCWPAAAAGTTRSTGRRRRCPRTHRLLRPGYLPLELLAGFLGEARAGRLPEPRRGVRPAGARGHGLRRARADDEAARHAGGRRATPSPTPSHRRRTRSPPPCRPARRPGAAPSWTRARRPDPGRARSTGGLRPAPHLAAYAAAWCRG